MGNNNDELTIKKERVLAAAEKCPTAKASLMEIFPEAFEKKDEWLDITLSCYCVPDNHGFPWVQYKNDIIGGAYFFKVRDGFKVEQGRIWKKV